MFISFEGIDGCGKSTQVKLLEKALRERNYDVLVLREPGATPLSEAVRNVLLSSNFEIDPTAELLLFCASRKQLTNYVILPALEKHTVVLCDRYADSSVAYQGYGRGISLDDVHAANLLATGGLKPVLTFFPDITVEESYIRAQRRKNFNPDRMERSGHEFFERVRNGYLEMSAIESERFRRLDGQRSIEELHCIIVEEVLNLLSRG